MASTRKTFIYRGEGEREFELIFMMAYDYDEYYIRTEDELKEEPSEPMGTIIVAKDFENSWIASMRYFFDWEVVIAPVASRFLKDYDAPHWRLLLDNSDAELSGYKYTIYESPSGEIIGETCLTQLHIADSLAEYETMSREQIARMCYASEMGRAR